MSKEQAIERLKRSVIMSMSSTLCAFVRGEIDYHDIAISRLWFNCHRCHVFGHIPMELVWTRSSMRNELGALDDKYINRGAIIDASQLTKHEVEKLELFREAVKDAEAQGNVSWRDDREQDREPTS